MNGEKYAHGSNKLIVSASIFVISCFFSGTGEQFPAKITRVGVN
tara:strand:- start:322 stop:453 length:132 start_codon:yes stop_codon:yes gene_type:complete